MRSSSETWTGGMRYKLEESLITAFTDSKNLEELAFTPLWPYLAPSICCLFALRLGVSWWIHDAWHLEFFGIPTIQILSLPPAIFCFFHNWEILWLYTMTTSSTGDTFLRIGFAFVSSLLASMCTNLVAPICTQLADSFCCWFMKSFDWIGRRILLIIAMAWLVLFSLGSFSFAILVVISQHGVLVLLPF